MAATGAERQINLEELDAKAEQARERRRLAALFSLDILQSPREPIIDKILRLARSEFQSNSAALVLIDRTTAYFQTRIGSMARRCAREGWLCNLTIAGHEPLVITDTATDPRCAGLRKVAGAPQARSYAGFPLLTRDGLAIGTMALFSSKPGQVAEGREDTGRALASIIMEALELHRLAARDPLTGAMNRRGFMEQLERAMLVGMTEGTPLTLVMIDIDRFKLINDRFGHMVGDVVLRRIAGALASVHPEVNSVGRIGGEEFVLLMPGLTNDQAVPLIEALRQEIAALTFPEAPDLKVSASFGISEYGLAARTDVQLLAQADAALYRSKTGGRNRWTLARDLPGEMHSAV